MLFAYSPAATRRENVRDMDAFVDLLGDLPTANMKNFAKSAVLRVAQWALDGRECHTTLADFSDHLGDTI
jgi:hypothetical protein